MTKLISLGRVSKETKTQYLSEVATADGASGFSPSQQKLLFCRDNAVAPYGTTPCDVE